LSPPAGPTPFPYTTLFRSLAVTGSRPGHMVARLEGRVGLQIADSRRFATEWLAAAIRQARAEKSGQSQAFRLTTSAGAEKTAVEDRKSTRLNSSHEWISYA